MIRTTLLVQKITGGFAASSSFTPPDNCLLVAFVGFTNGTGIEYGDDITITDSAGLTWTPRKDSGGSSPTWTYGCRVFTAPVTTGVSMTITGGKPSGTNEAYTYHVFAVTGYDPTTPVGATAYGTDADGDGVGSITLDGTPALDSLVIGFASSSIGSGTSPTIAAGTGWTELGQVFHNDYHIWQSQERTGSASTTVSWDDLYATGGGSPESAIMLALEIKAAGGGGGGPQPKFLGPVGQRLRTHDYKSILVV